MTRVKISIVILCLLVAVSIFSGVRVTDRCDDFLNYISEIRHSVEYNETENALAVAKDLENDWENFRKNAAVLLNNMNLSDIDRITARIVSLIENHNDEVYAELSELHNMIETLKDRELPQPQSIF